jgi:hypothetical protein
VGKVKILVVLACISALAGPAQTPGQSPVPGSPDRNSSTSPTGMALDENRHFQQVRDCDHYPLIQMCIDDTPDGGEAYVPRGTYPQGNRSLVISGKQLICAAGARITFTGLSAATDMVTLGWSLDTSRTGISGCTLVANASGRDGVRSNGGLGWFIRGVVVEDVARDCIHLEPDASMHWSENSDVEDIHCAFTQAKASTVRDGIHISLSDSKQRDVFLNKGTWKRINLRGYKGNDIHILANNRCAGCLIGTHVFEQVEGDTQAGTANLNAAVFFEKGAGGGPNQITNISFIGCDFEDTAGASDKTFVFKQDAEVLNGLFVYGAINGNYPQLFDRGVEAQCANNNIFILAPDGTRAFAPIQWLKNGSATHQFAWGMCTPGGGSPGDDAILSIFSSGAWKERFRASAAGGFDFSNANGAVIANISNSGALNQGAPGSMAGVSACVGGVKKIAFRTPYASPPAILVFDETTAGGAKLNHRELGSFEVSCSGETDAFSWVAVGNPN